MNKIVKSLKNNINYILFILLVCIIFKYLELYCFTNIQEFDNYVISFFKTNMINKNLTSMMKYITCFGDKIVISMITIIFILFYKNKKHSLYITINIIMALCLNLIVKVCFQRIRPYERLIEETGYSFPSGHTMCSTAFYGLFLYFIIKSNIKIIYKYIFSFFFILLIIFIGISRIYLGVHYFSDVIGAIILGTLSLMTFIKIINDIEGEKI